MVVLVATASMRSRVYPMRWVAFPACRLDGCWFELLTAPDTDDDDDDDDDEEEEDDDDDAALAEETSVDGDETDATEAYPSSCPSSFLFWTLTSLVQGFPSPL